MSTSARIRMVINPDYRARFDAFVRQVAEKGIPAGATDIYAGRNRVVALSAAGADGRARRLNIKEFRRPNVINRWVYGLHIRAGKARRAFENASRLRALGFDTPEPIAWIERRTPDGRMDLSYFISEQLDGWQEIRTAEASAHPRLAEIARGVGALIFRLHRAGVWMKDVSPGNILWHTDGDGALHFALVDINRMEFNVASRALLMTNFGRVFSSPALVEEAARAYAAEAGEAEERVLDEAREAMRGAARATRRKQRLRRLLHI